jgi:serine phosphatase RsbU (regulator of sigma subunit)
MIKPLLDLIQRLFLLGRGRPLALCILGVLLLVNILSEMDWAPQSQPGALQQTSEVLGSPFRASRQALFDGYQQLHPRQPQSAPVTIVAIDETSLSQLGQWPWPRNRTAALINTIAAHQPAAIGLDIYMPEADQTSPARVADNLPTGNTELATQLRQLPSHETQLAAALRAAPAVLGAAGFDFQTLSSSAGLRTLPLTVSGGVDPLLHVRNYPWVLASLPELQAAASGQALLSVDITSGVVRRMPLVMAVNGQLVPGLALEMLRVATGSPAIEVAMDARGVNSVAVADLTVPTQASGDIWLHFAKASSGAARYVSAAAVLAGQANPELLAGKLVLIGLTGHGLSDQRVTALGEMVPGIDIQAQSIESLFDGRVLLRPWWMKGLETLLVALIGALLVWRLPHAQAPQHDAALQTLPLKALWLTLSLSLVLLAAGDAAFVWAAQLVDAASAVIILALVLSSLVLSAMIAVSRHNALLAQEQQRLREEAAVAAGERSAAWRIQLGSLPKAEVLLASEKRLDLATLLEPAKDVGGDLYDFFMIDAQRLGFVIGDVSGKGLPASLFMAVTQTLTRSIAKHADAGPAAVAELANSELANVNPEALFVTMLIGVLDLETGLLTLVNAGHDSPWLIHPDGSMAHLDSPPDAGGPPICMVDDFPYQAQQAQLAPGDALVMYTDGITEAMNVGNEIYGGERLEKALHQAGTLSAQALIERIRIDVGRHVGTAEASDDMTLLVLRWAPMAPA